MGGEMTHDAGLFSEVEDTGTLWSTSCTSEHICKGGLAHMLGEA